MIATLAAALTLYPTVLQAKEAPKELSKSALESLARNFVARVGGKLKAHDAAAQAEKNAQEGGLSLIPDGEILLLRPKSQKFVMDAEIAALKHEGRMYYDLRDLIDRLELAIEYDDKKKVGSGWFLREDWLIRMDFVTNQVVSRGKTFTVKPEDIYMDEDTVFISQAAAQNWMEIKTEPDIAQQYLDIRTPVPYAALARNARKTSRPDRGGRGEAILPRHKEEYKNFDLNLLEVQQSARLRKSPDKSNTITHNNVTTVQSDVLGHSLDAASIWNNQESLTSLRARLTKEDEDPVLLGALGARAYSIGDTDTAQLPLTGGSTQELGMRVSNSPLRNSDFQSTNIRGDSLPGWDVELYRDGILVDRQRVDDSARYEFADVQLYAGDNTFEVFFYGPQGEIRQDSFNLPVTEELLAGLDNTYDVSLSFTEAQTYTKFRSEDEDANTPHLVARYNKMFGNTLTHTGIRARQENGEQKLYAGAGFTNVMGGIVWNGNAAADEKGASALELEARKNIADWKLSLRGNVKDEEYQAGDGENNVMSVLASANKTFNSPFGTLTTLNTTGLYGVRSDDSTQTNALFGVSNQIGRLNLSSTTSFDKIENVPGGIDPEPTINNTLAARMSWGKIFTRAGVDMNIKPENKVDNYFAQVSYQPTTKIGTDLQVEHDPDTRLTQGRLAVNYRGDKFRLSPFVQMDTDNEVEAGVKLTTTFVDKPGQTLPMMTGSRVIGRGLVSSFVFHDKNGNGVFDASDTPLPEVYVESVNVARRAATDEKGYSLIKDLPENIVTDIRVDATTLPDPFMISGFDGVSIYPKPGQMVNLNFPIHMAGEISGTVSMNLEDGGKQTLDGMELSLIPMSGKQKDVIETFASVDGYYVFDHVPPGNYLLTVNSNTAKRTGAGGASPIPVQVGFEGTILEGQDLTLDENRVQVPVEIKPYTGKDYKQPFFALQTGKSSAASKVSSLLSSLIERRTHISADEGLSPIQVEGEKDLKVLAGKDWQSHYDRCQLLNDSKIPCKVILFMPKAKVSADSVVAQK